MVVESWFRILWKKSKKDEFNDEKLQIGVLAFETAILMSKLLHLWQSLTDKQITRLREEITNSMGIKKLVSENDDYIGKLICVEMTENLANVARAVARLSKKCSDPLLKSFEQAFHDFLRFSTDTYGWQFSLKMMDRKVKTLKHFVIASTILFQEMETLADLEQSLKRMKCSDNADNMILVEYEKKVAAKRQEVNYLKGNSLWGRTYDYIILLLARTVFTIYGRIASLFGINHVGGVGVKDSATPDRYIHSTVFVQSSVFPSERCVPNYSLGSKGKIISLSGPILKTHSTGKSRSGPLQDPAANSSLVSRHNSVSFYSGSLGNSTSKLGPLHWARKNASRLWQSRDKSQNLTVQYPHEKGNQASTSVPFMRFMMAENGSPVNDYFNDVSPAVLNGTNGAVAYGNSSHRDRSIGSPKKLLTAPPETLGAAALALHYANVIIFIEKLVASPHLIGNDARDDLYNMLPASIKASLRAKLKPCTNILSFSMYDTVLVGEWNDAIAVTLEWLAPLAHNTIRWQSERSIEHQNLASQTNVLLVQTLFFANQEKTEDAITELLIGLNYVWRFGREINGNPLLECVSMRKAGGYLDS